MNNTISKVPTGTYSDKTTIEQIFLNAAEYHFKMFDDKIAKFQSAKLFQDWRMLIRSVDEWINIPLELPLTVRNQTGALTLELLSPARMEVIAPVLNQIRQHFGTDVAMRFVSLFGMTTVLKKTYSDHNIISGLGHGLTFANVGNASKYYQSRRQAYGGMLNLIKIKANGTQPTVPSELLAEFAYFIDHALVGYGHAYFNLLVNECLNDFEIKADANGISTNYTYHNLEGFFLEPERLSLLDQLELRPGIIKITNVPPKPKNKVFSYIELAATMALFSGAFQKYEVNTLSEYNDLNRLFAVTARFCSDDYGIIMDENELDHIQSLLPKFNLTISGKSFPEIMNDYSPFTKFEGKAYTTVPLLNRFAYRTLMAALGKNRSFAINSGFVFEDKVKAVLVAFGYHFTDFVRIDHKEFDLIMTKNGKVHNFQCKNNLIDIARAGNRYKLIARYNRYLINYYRKSIKKELNREYLVIRETKLKDVHHYVVSRFPVITRENDIVNFNRLEVWLKEQNH